MNMDSLDRISLWDLTRKRWWFMKLTMVVLANAINQGSWFVQISPRVLVGKHLPTHHWTQKERGQKEGRTQRTSLYQWRTEKASVEAGHWVPGRCFKSHEWDHVPFLSPTALPDRKSQQIEIKHSTLPLVRMPKKMGSGTHSGCA